MAKTLAVEYRPKTFDDVVEQEAVKRILQHQIDTGTFKNAYLFTGAAGTGKTTSARIFASAINGGTEGMIEIDAASNNSIDDIRGLTDMAKYKSLAGKYKVFVLDECFHGDTLVRTPYGAKPIRDIQVGDEVSNLWGVGTVTTVHKNKVLTSRLCRITINGVETMTTVDHLYLTQIGWVEAGNLKEGDVVYDGTYLHELWENFYASADKGVQVLLDTVFGRVQEDDGELQETPEGNLLYGLWCCILSTQWVDEADLFKAMQKCIDCAIQQGDMVVGNHREVQKGIITEDGGKQSNGRQENTAEDAGYQGKKWDFARLERYKGWQWVVHEASKSVVGGTWEESRVRVLNTNGDGTGNGLPKQVCSRPSLSRFNVGDRGGWQGAPIEVSAAKRCKEGKVAGILRVEGVEVYEQGDRGGHFSRCFADSDLSDGVVTMYDLEVSGHPSYVANGCLVHNCHALSSASFQALLKILEEPPALSIFILCTTDPQKIPGTILSRVQRFDFKRITVKGIVDRLTEIVDEVEQVSAEAEALNYIAVMADGCMREGISLLEKCISYDTNITMDSVAEALGVVPLTEVISLYNAITDGDRGQIINVIEGMYERGKDMKEVVSSLITIALDRVKFDVMNSWEYVTLPKTYKDFVENAVVMSTDDIMDLFTLYADIKFESNPKPLVMATLMVLAGV